MPGPEDRGIRFELAEDHVQALKAIVGRRQVRLSGRVVDDQLRVDFVACNAAFVACNAAFVACNAAFES